MKNMLFIASISILCASSVMATDPKPSFGSLFDEEVQAKRESIFQDALKSLGTSDVQLVPGRNRTFQSESRRPREFINQFIQTDSASANINGGSAHVDERSMFKQFDGFSELYFPTYKHWMPAPADMIAEVYNADGGKVFDEILPDGTHLVRNFRPNGSKIIVMTRSDGVVVESFFASETFLVKRIITAFDNSKEILSWDEKHNRTIIKLDPQGNVVTE